ncbi:nuclear transport factor 2 family protein [Streptomyces sp. NA04227]|uniref:nuclear transport factor 2 family protein n=1 Tax=Streptomyces sp. NA04227 TaxID=2742136 RepID=UPI0015916925|nr:nuclear transport factor 2 family protein [Streptomyces sp. NA04227]QKW07990.1 nuclear transport factor 2 family protein [Streptomyces sp. NA04227]
MGEHPDSTVIRKGYDAFNKGDMDALAGLMTADVVHHVPGHGELSGHHKGRDACIGLYRRMGDETAGKMRADLEAVCADGRGHVISMHRMHAERAGKKIDLQEGLFFTLVDGMISDIDECSADIEKSDDFWS